MQIPPVPVWFFVLLGFGVAALALLVSAVFDLGLTDLRVKCSTYS